MTDSVGTEATIQIGHLSATGAGIAMAGTTAIAVPEATTWLPKLLK